MINVGIVGATGYTGVELIRLLALHTSVKIKVVTSNSEKDRAVADVFPSLRTFSNLKYEAHDSPKLAQCDLVFFATPHATAMHYVPNLLEQGCKIIDLSADFRIKDPEIWKEWYAVKHACPELLVSAVSGHRKQSQRWPQRRNPVQNAVGPAPPAARRSGWPGPRASRGERVVFSLGASTGRTNVGCERDNRFATK